MKNLANCLATTCLLLGFVACHRTAFDDAAHQASDIAKAPAGDATNVRPAAEIAGQSSLAGKDRRFALLVGCSQYDHFGDDAQLQGPVNDVSLMKTLPSSTASPCPPIDV